MRYIFAPLAIFACVIICAFNHKKCLIVSSPAFGYDGVIPGKYTCYGDAANPPLQISNMPKGTQSLALIIIEPNAPTRNGFIHLLAWNIDTSGSIPENYITDFIGLNSAKYHGYKPICPTAGMHRYHFKAYALDEKLDLPADRTTQEMLEKAIDHHVLAEGELVGWYNKNYK
jgi:Raf kinase inhibitor-like YbhB/YbcL family protein